MVDLVGTILIFALIFYFFDFKQTFRIILHSDYMLILLALVSYMFVILWMAVRIRMVAKSLGYGISLIDSIKSNLAGMLASDFTPARTGYFFTSFSLTSKHNIPIHDSLLTIFGPQLFDFTIKAVSLVAVTFLLFDRIGGHDILFVVLGILAVFGAIGFFGALLFVPNVLKMFEFVKRFPFGDKFYSLFSLMGRNAHKLMGIKWGIIGVTLVSWAFKALEWFFISKALGIGIFDGGIQQYLFMVVFQASITLIQFLPLPTIAGGGASEFGFSGVLFFFGVPIEAGIAFALVTRVTMIVIDLFGIHEVLRYVRKEGVSGLLREISSLGN